MSLWEREKIQEVLPSLNGNVNYIFMIKPSQFQVNQAWIAFALNDAPIETQQDGDFNVIAVMDAASQFILTTEFVSTHSSALSQLESKRILKLLRVRCELK